MFTLKVPTYMHGLQLVQGCLAYHTKLPPSMILQEAYA